MAVLKLSTASGAAKITCVVLLYWTISISMVFSNKYLLGDNSSEIDVSLFVAWVQCIITVLFILCLQSVRALVGRLRGQPDAGKPDFSMAAFHGRFTSMKKIFLMTCTYVSMLTFNNLCLKHVDIAFYQVARSLTLIFTVIFSITLLKKHMSLKIFLCCLSVAGGFVLGIDQESIAGTLSIQGVCYGVVTSLFVSLNGIFTKKSLDVVGRDSVRLTLYNNINAIFLFLPFLLGTGQLQNVYRTSQFTNIYFWPFLMMSGVLSFSIAWISAVQIDLTSPVTHHISANTKAVLQTLLAVVYFHDNKQPLWWFSIVLVVAGALAYAIVRVKEEHVDKPKPQVPKDVESATNLLEEKMMKEMVNGTDIRNGMNKSPWKQVISNGHTHQTR